MINFANFAKKENSPSSDSTPIRVRLDYSNDIGVQMRKLLKKDYLKCNTSKDFEQYYNKYKRYETNEYVKKAKSKITPTNNKKKEPKHINPIASSKEKNSKNDDTNLFIFICCCIGFMGCLLGVYLYEKSFPHPDPIQRSVPERVVTPTSGDSYRIDPISFTGNDDGYCTVDHCKCTAFIEKNGANPTTCKCGHPKRSHVDKY